MDTTNNSNPAPFTLGTFERGSTLVSVAGIKRPIGVVSKRAHMVGWRATVWSTGPAANQATTVVRGFKSKADAIAHLVAVGESRKAQ